MTQLSITRKHPELVIISGKDTEPGQYYKVVDGQSDIDGQVVLCVDSGRVTTNQLISITTGMIRDAVESFRLCHLTEINITFKLEEQQ